MKTASQAAAHELRPLLATTIVLLLITTVAYPLLVTGIGQGLFHRQANGSMISVNGTDVGSSLIGQQFTGGAYFQGRPSAAGAGYDAANSSGSNLGPTSDRLINGTADDPNGISQRAQAFRAANALATDAPLPSDAVTSSASGLDSQVSPATALLQVQRVAKARGADAAAVTALVHQYSDGRVLGFIGQPRVNVLKLNIALDQRFPLPK